MLKEAAKINPDALLITWDFSKGLPVPFGERDTYIWDVDEYHLIVEKFKEQRSGFIMEFDKFSCSSGCLG
jgi:hypothetical protein